MSENLFEKLEREKEEYIKKYDVGFYVKDDLTKFIRTKRFYINYNWELKYSEITGVAFGNVMRFDDDSSFIIIIRGDKRPIYFNMTNDSEEMQEFDTFMDKLKNEIGLEQVWKQDKIVLAYPLSLKGKELYRPWKESLKTIIHEISRLCGIKHHVSGIIKGEFEVELKLKRKTT